MSRTLASRREATLAYDCLTALDEVLDGISSQHGRPDPFFWDDGGRSASSNFAAMVLHIISQQISAKVAFVMFDRLTDKIGAAPNPQNVLRLGLDELRAVGMSRAKASYVLNLAERHVSGVLNTEQLDEFDDQHVIDSLTSVRGVGPWTAQMFLLHQLRRPDVLPAGDLGIRHAVRNGWSWASTPSVEDVTRLGEKWSPYRSYAAALLWSSLNAAPSRLADAPAQVIHEHQNVEI
jgi:DNA-3-methyladenine glycosylase II